ncbi:MAG TPA: glycosyl hydrolase 108 family protein [Syntrophorhabdales bacterium]|nr:glycosyl hydrolase 108 family protein [Syntrophorhabdales bacterium]
MHDIDEVRQIYRGAIIPASTSPRPSSELASESFSGVLASQQSKDQAFDSAVSFVLENKKGYVAGENPMKYGIMQTTLKDYDPKGKIAEHVSQLDETKAKQIYRKIWERAGCDKLPYPLNVVHFDTYVQRPRTGIEALKKAQGDPQVYLDVRKSLQDGIKAYAPNRTQMRTRVDQLAAYVKLNTPIAETDGQSGAADTAQVLSKKKTPSNFETAATFIIKHEGTNMVQNDNGKGPARFGILQTTLKDLDPMGRIAKNVSELDVGKAKQIYKKIWYRAGCDKLSYPLNIIHFDTFMHRPNTAIQALGNSDGDPQLYLELRQTSLRGLKGYKKFANAWEGRIRNLSKLLTNSTNQAAEKKPAAIQPLEPERSS